MSNNNGLAIDNIGVPYNEWGQLVVEEIRKGGDIHLDKFGTILIDESQDMQPWQLELIRLHQGPSATVCCAYGRGQ